MVELTDERRQHILLKHPDVLPEYMSHVAETVAAPDEVRRDGRFPATRIFSRWCEDVRGGKFVVVVIVTGSSPAERSWVVTAYITRKLTQGVVEMEAQLMVEYDRSGDILYLGTTAPYPEQESEELDYGVVARLNPKSGEVENLEILFFSTRIASGEALRLPILAAFHLPERV